MLQQLLKPELEELIRDRAFRDLREAISTWTGPEAADLLNDLEAPDDVLVFRLLPRELATEAFEYLSLEKQQQLIEALAQRQNRLADLLNDLSPDDRTALLEELPGPVVRKLLTLLSPEERKVTVRLLGYPEDSIGRLMTPEYVAIRPEWTIQEALEHVRAFGRESETFDVVYIVDDHGRLIDDVHIRHIILADPNSFVRDIMDGRFVALKATDDQETAVQEFSHYGRTSLPVTDAIGILLGIVTIDDVLDVAEEEATEDIQKLGGLEALDAPYVSTPLPTLIQKRARWLVVLFFGEMLTATAMGYFQTELDKAVVLALFVPLIISSGGNSGSQAAALIIRALAVGELGLRDWWLVMRREILSGFSLGAILGLIGILRVVIWQQLFGTYGPYWLLIAITVGLSLVGVVTWGTLSGAMLPILMKKLGADPATSSTPFVATLVDVTGLVIYFTLAALLLSGTLL